MSSNGPLEAAPETTPFKIEIWRTKRPIHFFAYQKVPNSEPYTHYHDIFKSPSSPEVEVGVIHFPAIWPLPNSRKMS